MRKKLPENEKRSKIIGVKVTETTKKQLEYIAKREVTTVSSTIEKILQDYINSYFSIAKIDKTEIEEEGDEN